MAKVQLTGGAFQDSEGNVLNLGYLVMELSNDEQIPSTTQIGSGIKVTIELDANGNVFGTETLDLPKQYVWPNDLLTPAGSYYRVTAYTAKGQIAWGPQDVQVLSAPDPFNVGAWVPFAPDSSVTTVTVPTIEVNSVATTVQSVLDLVQNGNITIADLGDGRVRFTVPNPVLDIVIWYPSTTTTDQNLLHFNAVHALSFPASFSGSRATCVTPATVSTTVNVNKNGVNVGTIVFGIGASTGTFTTAGFTMAVNDYLDFVVVAGDATLAGIAITLTATRTS
jgi:hypothetical protein